MFVYVIYNFFYNSFILESVLVLKEMKVSTVSVVFGGCLAGICVGLVMLNYWNTSSCQKGNSVNEMEDYVEALNRRLLAVEAQVSPKIILFVNWCLL